jgi:hypothetical protein
MIYEAEIIEIDKDEYQGHLVIELQEFSLKTYYFASNEFIDSYLSKNKRVLLDLWLVIGKVTKINEFKKAFGYSIDGDRLRGEVKSVFSNRELRVDCGISIDVENEKPFSEINVGDYIETTGDFQVYFPETEWDRESIK